MTDLGKLRLFVYPQGIRHLHDDIPEYRDCVPFSEDGIMRCCEVVADPNDAEFFYMGQFHDNDAWLCRPERFEYFEGNESRHIVDIEGDWRDVDMPEFLKPCIVTAVKSEGDKTGWNITIRPTFSKLITFFARSVSPPFIPPTNRLAFFRGQMDVRGIRERVAQGWQQSGMPGHFQFTSHWNAPTGVESPEVWGYVFDVLAHGIGLCPIGSGPPVRWFELCALGRMPIVIGNHALFCEDEVDPFWIRIPQEASVEEIADQLRAVGEMPDDEIVKRCIGARVYWEQKILPYFKDPTQWMIERMIKKGE